MQVSRLHRVTHTGILSTASSTAPHGTASANALCSSTAQVHEHHSHVFYPLKNHLANFSFLPLFVEIRKSVPSFSLPHERSVHEPEPEASVVCFSPDYLRRTITRPVSYYALFECVAASKPTSWLSMQLHILSHLTHTLGP